MYRNEQKTKDIKLCIKKDTNICIYYSNTYVFDFSFLNIEKIFELNFIMSFWDFISLNLKVAKVGNPFQ